MRSDSQILEDYFEKACSMVQKKFKPHFTREFTRKVLHEQIYKVNLDEIDCELPNNKNIEKVKGHEVQKMVLDSQISLEEVFKKYHKFKQ